MKCWLEVDLAFGEALSRAHFGQAAELVLFERVVLAFLVKGEKSVELDHRAGGAQINRFVAGP